MKSNYIQIYTRMKLIQNLVNSSPKVQKTRLTISTVKDGFTSYEETNLWIWWNNNDFDKSGIEEVADQVFKASWLDNFESDSEVVRNILNEIPGRIVRC